MSDVELPRSLPTRRHVLQILGMSAAAAGALAVARRGVGSARSVTRSTVLMGTATRVTVVATDREEATAAADAVLAEMARLESVLSAYRPDSAVSRLNAIGRLPDPDPALVDVLSLGARVSALGDGAFDLTVQALLDLYEKPQGASVPSPAAVEAARALVDYRAVRIEQRAVALARPAMRITVDGIATGYILDRGVDVFRTRGFSNVLVDVGGDIVARGERAPGRPWRIGLRNPRPGTTLLGSFLVRDGAVATSGDYLHSFTDDYTRHHIVDPRTGSSPPELASATVIAPDAATADALSTLTLVLGARRSRELLEALPGCEGCFVGKDGKLTRTAGFRLV